MTPLNNLVSLAVFTSLVSAHGHIQTVIVDGQKYPGWDTDGSYNNPPAVVSWITNEHYMVDWAVYSKSVNQPDIICHKDGKPAKLYVTAHPGQEVIFKYNDWPIQVHPGPALEYVAACDGECTTVDKTTLKWVKFAQKGWITGQNGKGMWATDAMVANRYQMSITIPNWKPGNYVVRHELINLDRSGPGNTEMYPNCVNFKIIGNGTEEVVGGVLGTAIYNVSEPGLVKEPKDPQTYQFPGPALAKFTYP